MTRYLYNICFLFIIGCFLTACSQPVYYVTRPVSNPTYEQVVVSTPVKVNEPVKTPVKRKAKALIVVDAGHGGKDLGAESDATPKYQEKILTLSTARMLKTYLEQLGHTVIMTRDSDVFIALDDRADFANKRKPAAFVSVHFNTAPNKEAEGIEVFYYRSDTDKIRSATSKILAQDVLKRSLEQTQAKSRGVKHGNLAVIRETKMPAILIEGGFLTHATEVQKLKNANYLKQLAWGIAQGVDDFVADEDDES
ncbi:MAG: N-acetylmuramoyl-L-alanine amidase [Parachlamydiaceae bacterium]|nr:N-acetylmuramoyl-L-alanine amidase [Parachlamydiaceae bacterium]